MIKGNIKPTKKITGSIVGQRIYPDLEDLKITPTTQEQSFKSSKYGYDNVTVAAIESDTIIVEPTTKQQSFNGLYDRVIVNAIETEELNITPKTEEQTYNGLYDTVKVSAIEGDTLEVTPTTESQNFTGIFDNINVEKVTSKIDSNISAENIKEGVTILDVTGTLKESGTLPIDITKIKGTLQIKLNRRNILPSPNTTRTINGVTFTHNSDGSITVNGTATANATYNINENVGYVSQTVPLKANTKYILSAGVENITSSTYIVQAYYKVNGSLVYKLMTKTGTLIETVEETVLGAYVRVYSGVTVNNIRFYPMIEEVTDETVASEYHPYNSIKLVDDTTATISVGTGDITTISLN